MFPPNPKYAIPRRKASSFTYVASGVSRISGPPSVTIATRVLEEVLHVPTDAAHPPAAKSESSTTVWTFARSKPVFSTDNSENSTNSPVRVLLMTCPTTGGGDSGVNDTRLLLGMTGSKPEPLMLKKYLPTTTRQRRSRKKR